MNVTTELTSKELLERFTRLATDSSLLTPFLIEHMSESELEKLQSSLSKRLKERRRKLKKDKTVSHKPKPVKRRVEPHRGFSNPTGIKDIKVLNKAGEILDKFHRGLQPTRRSKGNPAIKIIDAGYSYRLVTVNDKDFTLLYHADYERLLKAR